MLGHFYVTLFQMNQAYFLILYNINIAKKLYNFKRFGAEVPTSL